MHYKEYKICSKKGCDRSQSLKICPTCKKPYCWQCMELAYDKEGKCKANVCPDCIAKNPGRFSDETPPRLNNAKNIIYKLTNKEPLTEEETSDFTKWLESFSG